VLGQGNIKVLQAALLVLSCAAALGLLMAIPYGLLAGLTCESPARDHISVVSLGSTTSLQITAQRMGVLGIAVVVQSGHAGVGPCGWPSR